MEPICQLWSAGVRLDDDDNGNDLSLIQLGVNADSKLELVVLEDVDGSGYEGMYFGGEETGGTNAGAWETGFADTIFSGA